MNRIYGKRRESIRTGMFVIGMWWGLVVCGKVNGIHIRLSKTMHFNAIGLDGSNEEARLLPALWRCLIRHWRSFSVLGLMGLSKNFYH